MQSVIKVQVQHTATSPILKATSPSCRCANCIATPLVKGLRCHVGASERGRVPNPKGSKQPSSSSFSKSGLTIPNDGRCGPQKPQTTALRGPFIPRCSGSLCVERQQPLQQLRQGAQWMQFSSSMARLTRPEGGICRTQPSTAL